MGMILKPKRDGKSRYVNGVNVYNARKTLRRLLMEDFIEFADAEVDATRGKDTVFVLIAFNIKENIDDIQMVEKMIDRDIVCFEAIPVKIISGKKVQPIMNTALKELFSNNQ